MLPLPGIAIVSSDAVGPHYRQVGEFQCYDRRALASLAAAAQRAGRSDWGCGGPHNAGHYSSHPEVSSPTFCAPGVQRSGRAVPLKQTG